MWAPHGPGHAGRGVAFLAGSPATLPLRLSLSVAGRGRPETFPINLPWKWEIVTVLYRAIKLVSVPQQEKKREAGGKGWRGGSSRCWGSALLGPCWGRGTCRPCKRRWQLPPRGSSCHQNPQIFDKSKPTYHQHRGSGLGAGLPVVRRGPSPSIAASPRFWALLARSPWVQGQSTGSIVAPVPWYPTASPASRAPSHRSSSALKTRAGHPPCRCWTPT